MTDTPEENQQSEQVVQTNEPSAQPNGNKKTFTWKKGVMFFAGFAALFLLVFGIVVIAAPYVAMRMYSNTNNQRGALQAATRYINRHESQFDAQNNPSQDSSFANALLLGVNYSFDRMEASIARRGFFDRRTIAYAQQLDRFATMYLSMLSLRSLLVDTEMLTNNSITRREHVDLIYFHERVRQKQTRARHIHWNANGYDIMYMPAGDYHWNCEEWAEQEIRLTMYESTIQFLNLGLHSPFFFRALNNVTQILRFDLERMGFFEHVDIYADNGFIVVENFNVHSTPAISPAHNGDDTFFNIIFSHTNGFNALYDILLAQIEDIFDFVTANYQVGTSRERLTRLYQIKSVTEFVRTMYFVTQVMNNDRQNKFVAPLLSDVQNAALDWQNVFVWGRVGNPPSPAPWPSTEANMFARFQNVFLAHYVSNL
ncbi:MAG: hypothetical protein FWC11_06595 [Firmicutes bacterium]|nr:hypothetical protein [Bacillota bacterium]MCL2256497.1 hypothetical protein [Bacillota bacterium]